MGKGSLALSFPNLRRKDERDRCGGESFSTERNSCLPFVIPLASATNRLLYKIRPLLNAIPNSVFWNNE